MKGSSSRRSLYVKVIRNTPDPLLSAFDSPPGFSSTPTRNVTTTAPQALLMLNGSWALTRASVLAKRLSKECGDDLPAQVSLAYQLAYGRTPTDDESSVAVRFLQQRSPVASPEQMKKESIVKTFPGRDSHAIDFSGVGSTKTLRVPHSSQLPVSDFTVEAYVMLRSLFEDAAVRTIVSHWDSNTSHPGWALGVTSKKSRYTPQNLILQMVGDPAKKGGGYEVIASGIHLELNRPYYVAATVKLSGRKKGQVVFHVKDLAKDSKLQEATVLHGITGHFHTKLSIVLGGRDHGGQNHVWDGLIDDVRISRGALSKDQLIVQGGKLVTDETIGFWKFEAEPGIYHDSATRAGDIQLQQIGTKPVNASQRKLTDLCHALLNSNEFLYVD